MMHRLTWCSLLVIGLVACSGGSPPANDVDAGSGGGNGRGDGGGGAAPIEALVKSFAHVSPEGAILGVGVVVPVKSFEDVPSGDQAFQSDVGIEMPASVRDRTFLQLLRINWLSSGHGPAPYGEPHFDMHFYRGTRESVDAITCFDTSPFPAEVLVSGYETPSTCVAGMGYHAWPTADIVTGTFSASIILGYASEKMVFIEPMITRARFIERKSFELAIPRPASTGGATTLFPSHLAATYDAGADAYTFEFDHFETID